MLAFKDWFWNNTVVICTLVSSFYSASSFHENIQSCLIHNVWYWLITSYLFFSFDVAKYYKMVAQIYCQVKSGAHGKTEECKFTYKMAHRNIFLFLDKQKIKSLKISAHMSSVSFPLTFLLQAFCTVKANTSEHNLLSKKEGQFIHPFTPPKTGGRNPDFGTVPSLGWFCPQNEGTRDICHWVFPDTNFETMESTKLYS